MSYRIGVLTGNWGANIGNAFFHVGVKYALEKLRPGFEVRAVPEVAGYIFPKKVSPKNGYEWVLNQQLDYVVLDGPFIRPEFAKIALPTLKELAELGVRFIGLGVGMMDYSPAGYEETVRELAKLPFDFITTRDHATFRALSPLDVPLYNGIDFGFFLPEFTPPIPLRSRDYVVLNFDVTPEPKFIESAPGPDTIEINGKHFTAKFPKWRTGKCFDSVAYSILDKCLLPQSQITEVSGLKVIRTDHRLNPTIKNKIYCSPNTSAHDVWEPYASIYSGPRLTLTNRVHAAVATLAYGNPARLYAKTGRKALLERVGAGDVVSKVVSLDLAELDREKAALLRFIDAHLPGARIASAEAQEEGQLLRKGA